MATHSIRSLSGSGSYPSSTKAQTVHITQPTAVGLLPPFIGFTSKTRFGIQHNHYTETNSVQELCQQ